MEKSIALERKETNSLINSELLAQVLNSDIVKDINFLNSMKIILNNQTKIGIDKFNDALFLFSAKAQNSVKALILDMDGKTLTIDKTPKDCSATISFACATGNTPFNIIVKSAPVPTGEGTSKQVKIDNKLTVDSAGRTIICDILEVFSQEKNGKVFFTKNETSKFYDQTPDAEFKGSGIMDPRIEKGSTALSSMNAAMKNAGWDMDQGSTLKLIRSFVACNDTKEEYNTNNACLNINRFNNGWLALVHNSESRKAAITYNPTENKLEINASVTANEIQTRTYKSYTAKNDENGKPFVEYIKQEESMQAKTATHASSQKR